MRYLPVVFFAIAAALIGQTAPPGPAAPVELRRTTPARTFADSFDFDSNVNALQQSLPGTPDPPTAANSPESKAGNSASVPKGYQPPADVALSSTAQQAVQFSATWRAQQNAASPGPDGRVLLAFGAGLPTVVCAPLRVCLIELQPGEKLEGEPQIGDSVRWNVSQASYGKGEESTAVLVLKPQMPGLDTNLLITTDRRAYYVRLVSKAEDYVSRVAFVYNDDNGGKKWKEHFAEQKREELTASRISVGQDSGLLIAVGHLNFAYQVKGGEDSIRPRRVFDDGSKTYIQMSSEVTNRETPVLIVLGTDGKGEIVNYRIKKQTYIIDRLFERAQLVLGSGKKAQKVEINREHRN